MINHQAIESKLVKHGFEKTTLSDYGCWVNRTNNAVCFRGTYSPQFKGKTNYTFCLGQKRNYIYSEDDFEQVYNDLIK